MIKLHLIFMIAVVSLFLLTIQLITLQLIVQKTKPNINHQLNLIRSVVRIADEHNIPLIVIDQNVLRSVADSCTIRTGDDQLTNNDQEKLSPHASLFETVSGQRSRLLTQNVIITRRCRHFCDHERKITHFATLADLVSNFHIVKFIESLRREQLTCIELSESSTQYSLSVTGYTNAKHLIIFDERRSKSESYLIHLSILDEIMTDFWFSEPLVLSEHDKRIVHRQGIRKMNFQFDEYSQIYLKSGLQLKHIDQFHLYFPEESQSWLQTAHQNRFIKCNRSRAKQFYETYGLSMATEDLQFKMNAHRLLKQAKALLDELNIPFWLSSGTCLGYFRQCDYITYSGDVDIGIFARDFRPEMIDVFLMHDLPLIHRFGRPNDSFELSFRNEFIKLDIFFFYESSDHFWNGGTQAKTGAKFKYRFPKFDLCWTDFLDLLVRVPCDTLTYVQANYGPKWTEPVRQWDWKDSPSNVQSNGHWSPDEWQQVIQLNLFPDIS